MGIYIMKLFNLKLNGNCKSMLTQSEGSTSQEPGGSLARDPSRLCAASQPHPFGSSPRWLHVRRLQAPSMELHFHTKFFMQFGVFSETSRVQIWTFGP